MVELEMDISVGRIFGTNDVYLNRWGSVAEDFCGSFETRMDEEGRVKSMESMFDPGI